MPPSNSFAHQRYDITEPLPAYELIVPPAQPEIDSAAYDSALHAAADQVLAARVRAIFLIHGTAAGTDALGWIGELERALPQVAGRLRRQHKRLVDRLVGDHGNYSPQFRERLDSAINRTSSAEPVRVWRFQWSSQNHHLARAEGAVLLIDRLLRAKYPAGSRVLLFGHSHGGNVLALVSNLLGGSVAAREAFFAATRSYVTSLPRGATRAAWQRTQILLMQAGNPLDNIQLEMVTFGTPVRYGWDCHGFHQVLHFSHHRVHPDCPEYRAFFPHTLDEVRAAATGVYGDYIQLLGIAGTNLPPPITNWQARRTDRRLNALLQPPFRRKDLFDRLRAGARLAHEGVNLLVDYAAADPEHAKEMAGHAVYTSLAWLPFHLQQIADRMFASGDT